MKYYRPKPKNKRLHAINEEIHANEVRLIDEDKSQLGVVPIQRALEIAKEKELDLVAISPSTIPPVCRILDYGKYIYSIQKKAHEAQKQQKRVQIKEIKFTPVIGDHDIEFKLKKIKQFLEEGNRVKITIWLRGRQKRRPEMLDQMTERIIKILKEFAEIESAPKKERFACYLLIGQKKGGQNAKTEES